MTTGDARDIVTGQTPDCSAREIIAAWQLLVMTGKIQTMGDWYQKMADALIATGKIEGFDGA